MPHRLKALSEGHPDEINWGNPISIVCKSSTLYHNCIVHVDANSRCVW